MMGGALWEEEVKMTRAHHMLVAATVSLALWAVLFKLVGWL